MHVFRDIDKRAAGLKDSETVLLQVLLAHRNGRTGKCNPSLPTLAKKTGKSERQLQRLIKGLESRGILRRELGRQHAATRYGFNFDGLPLANAAQSRHPDVAPDLQGSGAARATSRASRGDIRTPQGRHLDVARSSGRTKEEKGAVRVPGLASTLPLTRKAVSAWAEGVRSVTGVAFYVHAGDETARLAGTIHAHAPRGVDIVDWSRRVGAEFARAHAGRPLKVFLFEDWLNSNKAPPGRSSPPSIRQPLPCTPFQTGATAAEEDKARRLTEALCK